MKPLLFFILITGNTLLAADFNYSHFAGNFSGAKGSGFCADTLEVSFAGSKMITIGGCKGSEPSMAVYACENENNLPKCKVDNSLPQKDLCASNTIQFLPTGDYFMSNRCRNVTFLYKRENPLISLPQLQAQDQQQEQPQPETNDGRFD